MPGGHQRRNQPIDGVLFRFEVRLQPQRRQGLGGLGSNGGRPDLRKLVQQAREIEARVKVLHS